MATCPVCSEVFSKAAYGGRFWANTDYMAHVRGSHPEYYSWQRTWGRIIGLPAAIIVAVLLVLFVPGRGGSPPLITNPSGALVGLSVLGVSAAVVVAMFPLRARSLARFRREWVENRDQTVVVGPELSMVQSQGLGISLSPGTVTTDDSILQVAKQLRDQFNIDPTRFSPMRIEWLDYIPLPRGGQIKIPSDRPMFDKHRIILSRRLQQAFSLDDWRPIVASGLLAFGWQRARGRRMLGLWLVVTAIIYALLAFFAIFFPSQSQVVTGAELILGLFGWLPGLIVMGLVNAPKRHREIFDADRQIAGLMGKDAFLETLGKLENQGEDFSSPTRRLDRYKAPTVKERIDNLKSLA